MRIAVELARLFDARLEQLECAERDASGGSGCEKIGVGQCRRCRTGCEPQQRPGHAADADTGLHGDLPDLRALLHEHGHGFLAGEQADHHVVELKDEVLDMVPGKLRRTTHARDTAATDRIERPVSTRGAVRHIAHRACHRALHVGHLLLEPGDVGDHFNFEGACFHVLGSFDIISARKALDTFRETSSRLRTDVAVHGGGQSGSRARTVSATNSIDRRRRSRASQGGRSRHMQCCHWPIVAQEMGTAPIAPGSVGPTSMSQSITQGVRMVGKSGARSSMAIRCSRVSGSASVSGLICLVVRGLGAVPSHASCRT